MSAVLVTGGAGFVGSHFVRAAVEAGRRVVVLDDLSGGPGATPPEGVELIQGDVADTALVAALCDRHDVGAVAHFAGKIQVAESVRRPDLYFEANLVRTLRLLEAVRGRVDAFLFSSTAAVYGLPDAVPIPETAPLSPISPYGSSKLAVEYALQAYGAAYGLHWAALRYFNAAGAHPDGTLCECHQPETHLVPLAIDAALGKGPALTVFGDDWPTPDGTCVRDYVHVCDLAEAHLAALDALSAGKEVGAVNLGSGTGFTVRQVIEATALATGRPVPHSLGPRRQGDPARLLADPSRAAATLGWKAKRSDLAAILEDAVRSRFSS